MGLASPFHRITSLIAQFPFFLARRKRLIISSLFVNYWAVCKEMNIFNMVRVGKKMYLESKHGVCAFHGIQQWWKSYVGNYKPKEKKRPISPYFNRSCDFQWSWITRICVDFKNLNRACPKDEFSLPNMDLLIDSTAGSTIFSFMDGFNGYNQIRMALRDTEKIAFRTPMGNFYNTVMPFELKIAGATY